MSFNIYKIYHPLVSNWLNQLYLANTQQYHIIKKLQNISIALIYEATRKWIQSQKIYIEKLNSIFKTTIIQNNINYILITDQYFMQILGKEIYNLMPQIHVSPSYKKNIHKLLKTFNTASYNNKIIILEAFLDSFNIILTIQQLLEYNFIISDIMICCITCEHKELEKISEQYPVLNIYTTEIIDAEQNHQNQILKQQLLKLQ